LLFVAVITFFVPALLTLHGLKARRVDASTITGPEMTGAVMPAPALPPSDDQIMNIAYFTEQGDMNSTLRLNNNLLGPMTATVTFFNSHGEWFTAPLLTLPPQDVQRFRIADLTANASGDFQSGNVQVFYHGPAMAVTGQVTVASSSTHLIFESFPTMSMGFASTRLDGIVWTPDAGTQASAALTNTTTNMLTVNIGSAANTQSLTLRAHETRVVELKDFLLNRQDVRAALIRIEHNGTPGAVIVTGFALNEKTGFSCNLPFIDRATAKTAHLAGAHVRFGRPGSKEGFPAGTRFNAPLLIANAGDQPTEARVFVDYTIGGVSARAEIAKLELAPSELRQVELSSAMARFAGSGPVDDAGVDIEYSGSPGAVIARLTSVDQSGDLAFDVPIKDPLAEMLRAGGSYPWRLDGGFTTVLHLKNTVNQRVFALVQVRYNGGSYNLERLPLQPYQTIAVDIRALRDGQQKDIRDSVMPSDVEGGQVVWFEETVGSLIGRAEMRNVAEGMASSFSCTEPCQCSPSFYTAFMTPASSVGPMGGTGQFQSMEQRQDCHGTIFGPYNRTSDSTWQSDNTSVFTVTAGTVSCLQPGSGNVTAQFQAIIYTLNCFEQHPTPTVGGGVQVFDFFVTFSSFVLYPSGTGGSSSTTVTVYTTPPVASQQLSLLFGEIVGEGGHVSHSGARPLGSLTATHGTTGGDGTFQTTYSAPAFGGRLGIFARFGTVDRGETMTVSVANLSSLGTGTNYNLVGSTTTHPDNHYGTWSALSNLPSIANDYQTQFYGQNAIPDAEKLLYNDMSLVSGGKFDLSGNWCTSCSHFEHTLGINCDVGSSNVPTSRWAVLNQIFFTRNVQSVNDETASANHWHLRF
jgi:hypothetical protein